jgi:Mycoplasma protein of unknown function, DUF285
MHFCNIGLEIWNTSQVRTMEKMLTGAIEFDANLSRWETSQVTNMAGMIAATANFSGIGLEYWDVGHVTTMKNMFTMEDPWYVETIYFDAN